MSSNYVFQRTVPPLNTALGVTEMKWQTIAASAIGLFSAACAAEPIQAPIDRMMAICMAHPDFRASSIDVAEPAKSQSWEKEFYDTAKVLHQRGREPSGVLMKMRTTARPEQTRCIDNILNTWPG